MVRCGKLSPGQTQFAACCHFTTVMIVICWVITAPALGPQVQVPRFTHPWPAPFQGGPRGAGLAGEVRWRLGGRRGRVSFLSPTHTGLRLVLPEVVGALCLSPGAHPVCQGPQPHSLPCPVSSSPVRRAPMSPSCPPRNRSGGIASGERAGVTSWAGRETARRHLSLGPPAPHYPITVLSGGTGCGEEGGGDTDPQSLMCGSKQEFFGRQARDKITLTSGQ